MMTAAITAVRTALLLFSLLGYIHTAAKKLRAEFALGAVFACIGSAIFLAGILNVLRLTAWLICAGGALLTIRSIVKKESFRGLFCYGTAFFVLCCVLYAVVLYGDKFVDYDCFSHWARVTKIMLHEHRVPNFLDSILSHQSYPTGSASFIYYILTIIGTDAEWMQMYAQAVLVISFTVSLFPFTSRFELAGLTAGAAVSLFCCNVSFVNLQVDTLIPMAALGGMAVCVYYRDSLQEKLYWTVPYTVLLLAIKNSGLFFGAVILVYALTQMDKTRRTLRSWAICALCPAAAMLLWQRHVALVFANGLHSRHAMNLSSFAETISSKSPEDIRIILSNFAGKTFSLSNDVLYLVALLAVCLILSLWLHRSLRSLRRCVCLAVCVYAAYQISLLGMYLFSMEGGLALNLGSYARYHRTILDFLAGLLWIEVLTAGEDVPAGLGKRVITGGVGIVCLALLYFSLRSPILHWLQKQDFSSTERAMLEQIIDEYDIPSGRSYLILVNYPNPASSQYAQFLSEYLLDPPARSRECTSDELAANSELLEQYDYLIVYSGADDCRAYMEEHFGDADLRAAALKD